jgi:hypothetical protein
MIGSREAVRPCLAFALALGTIACHQTSRSSSSQAEESDSVNPLVGLTQVYVAVRADLNLESVAKSRLSTVLSEAGIQLISEEAWRKAATAARLRAEVLVNCNAPIPCAYHARLTVDQHVRLATGEHVLAGTWQNSYTVMIPHHELKTRVAVDTTALARGFLSTVRDESILGLIR